MSRVRYVKKEFPLPPEGIERGKIIEAKELGFEKCSDGEMREKVRVAWALAHSKDAEGNSLLVFQKFNRSLHPESFFGKFLFDLYGRNFDDFEIQDVVGEQADLALKHSEPTAEGRVYCNIVAIYRKKTEGEAAEEQRVQAVTERVRQAAAQDSHKLSHSPAPPNSDAETTITDEDIPF